MSVVQLYMSITALAQFTYVTSSRERWKDFSEPFVALVTDRRRTLLLGCVMIAVPCLASLNVYIRETTPLEAPVFGRTVHPAPPDKITVKGEDVNLVTAQNPFRELAQRDPQAFQEHLQNGRRVYYQNCLWCHGDDMRGDGMFAHGLNPIPTNFQDPGTIAMLQESFLFWRIAKGGPGLPEEAGPWDSAMPAWEEFLTTDEIWDVILFLYDFTGQKPRAREEHGH
jgi:mono/diheme cytochrome c family protein